MNAVALYLLLLKATIGSFSGFGSLPQVRQDLVVSRHLLTDDQLNRAVLVARTTPGPMGVYVISVGYQVSGATGAIAAWFALITPAILVLPLWQLSGRVMTHPRVRGAIAGIIVASAVLILTAGIPLAVDTYNQWRDLLLL